MKIVVPDNALYRVLHYGILLILAIVVGFVVPMTIFKIAKDCL